MKSRSRSGCVSRSRLKPTVVLVAVAACLNGCQNHSAPYNPWEANDRLAESLNIKSSQLEYWKPGHR